MSALPVENYSSENAPIRVAVFKNRSNQAVRIPVEFSFPGTTELEMRRVGESLILSRPKPGWDSFFELSAADDDFLADRQNVVEFRPAIFDGSEE